MSSILCIICISILFLSCCLFFEFYLLFLYLENSHFIKTGFCMKKLLHFLCSRFCGLLFFRWVKPFPLSIYTSLLVFGVYLHKVLEIFAIFKTRPSLLKLEFRCKIYCVFPVRVFCSMTFGFNLNFQINPNGLYFFNKNMRRFEMRSRRFMIRLKLARILLWNSETIRFGPKSKLNLDNTKTALMFTF
jgi:hypothetical protein